MIMDEIDQLARWIGERFYPERVFGSRARGGAGPESDVALFVVKNYQGSSNDR